MADVDIIINELLAFVQNKIDVLDEISIVQICVSNFTETEIEVAKTVLFGSISDSSRCVTRKGEDKNKKNLKDILKLLKETDPSLQPAFVAKNLNRLPPVTFDYIDVTRLLKDLSIMKMELQSIRSDTVSKSEMITFQANICSDLENLRTSLNKCGEGRTNQIETQAAPRRTAETKECSNNVICDKRSMDATTVASLRSRSRSRERTQVQTPTYCDIVHKNINNAQSKVDPVLSDIKAMNGFTLVGKKKRILKTNMCGTAKNSGKIQVAELSAAVYISRLNKSTTEDDIKEYIREMGETCKDVQLLVPKYQTEFKSFKVVLTRKQLIKFLSTEFWPEGIKYRRFREYAKPIDNSKEFS